jgi:hypothetical protein
MNDPVTQFREFIISLGLECPEELIADGKLHRFSGSGRRGDKSSFYVLFLDGAPAGAVGDWRSGLKETWKASISRPLTDDERKRQKARIDAQRRMRNAQIWARHWPCRILGLSGSRATPISMTWHAGWARMLSPGKYCWPGWLSPRSAIRRPNSFPISPRHRMARLKMMLSQQAIGEAIPRAMVRTPRARRTRALKPLPEIPPDQPR